MTFPTSTPSTQGIDPAGLHAFLDALDTDPVIEPHGLIIQRHGRRVLEGYWRPHTAEQIRLVYSLSKSFTGTALGLAIGDGLVDLDDLVGDHLPELTADASARTLEMRVRHLASMSTGHADETLLDAFIANPTDPLAGFFTVEPQHDPGTWFAYNQPPVLALSALLQHATGRRMNDLLRERVLDPIGIRDLRWYQHRPEVDLGFSGVFTNLDAIARLGQLYLDDGMWDGEQVLPQGWVALASSTQTDNSHRPEPDWSRGYGFQFWMCRHGYRGDGAFGQYMVILPEHDTVVAFFSHTEPMQSFMDLIWDVLLPALGPTTSRSPRPITTSARPSPSTPMVTRRTPNARRASRWPRQRNAPVGATRSTGRSPVGSNAPTAAPTTRASRRSMSSSTSTSIDPARARLPSARWSYTRVTTRFGSRCRAGGPKSTVTPSRRALRSTTTGPSPSTS